MKAIIATLIIGIAGVAAWGQLPTLQIVTNDPNLPSEVYYGNIKLKPLRIRPGTNPPQFITIDDADFFTQEQYIDFLSRMPDAAGFTFWMGQISNCGNNVPCAEVQRINVSGSFFLSIEFQQTGYLVERAYKSAYGDALNATSTLAGSHSVVAPIVRVSEFIPDVKQMAQGVIVLQPGWETILKKNQVAYFNSFVQRTAFISKYPTSKTPGEFVDALFSNTGVTPTAAERSTAIGEFGGADDTTSVSARAKA